MKLSSEVKIGILASVTLAILIIGYRFLKGSNIFDRSKVYYAVYRDVEMLDASAPVLARGIKVGSVIKVALKPDNPDSVVVTLDVKEDILLPKDAKAVLVSTGLMGGKAVELRFTHHCQDDCLPNKGFIQSETQSLLGGMIQTDEVKSYFKDLGPELDTLMNNSQLGSNVNKSSVDLAITLKNFAEISKQLQSLLQSSDKHIQNSLQNINKLSNSLVANTKTIDKTLNNLSAITEQLKEADPGKLVKNSDQAIQEINKTVSEAKGAVKQLSNLLTEIDKGQGSLGKLIKDPALYKNLERSSKNIDLLLQDMRLNPNRYIHISVFGSKNKQYEKPAQDPAE